MYFKSNLVAFKICKYLYASLAVKVDLNTLIFQLTQKIFSSKVNMG